MLAEMMPPNESFNCAEAPLEDGKPIEQCGLSGFRITPLASHHALNIKVLSQNKLNKFVDRIEAGISSNASSVGPINKSADDAALTVTCGRCRFRARAFISMLAPGFDTISKSRDRSKTAIVGPHICLNKKELWVASSES
jgi:hypothetical protein